MATRRDANQSGRRRKPASQGHPSRGGVSVGGGTKSPPKRYVTPPAPKPYVPPAPAPSRQVHRARSKRKAAVRSQRKFAKTVRQAAGISTPLGEFERQSMRYANRAKKARASLPSARDLLHAQQAQAERGPRLPRNDYIEHEPATSGPLRRVERAYLDTAKPSAALTYAQRRKQAGEAERKSNRRMAATRAKDGKNLFDKALSHGAATLASNVFGAGVAREVEKSNIKPTRLPPALWHGVTQGRADDVQDPENISQIAEGAIGGLVESVAHPKKAVEEMAKDLEKRYGDYVTGRIGTDEYKRRVAHTPRLSYLADAAALVPLGGTATAAGTKVLARGVARAALKHGAEDAARKAARIADYLDPKVARPKLASRPGRAEPQRTPVTGGFRLTFQRELDRMRAKSTAKRATRARPSSEAISAVEEGAVQPISSLGRSYVARRAARPEYSRWKHRLMSKNARFNHKVMKQVQRLIGKEHMDDGTLAVAMMTGATTRAGLKAEAAQLRDMFHEGRELHETVADKVHAQDNIADMERILATPDDKLPDEQALREATRILRENNEVLKALDDRLDPGVRMHELEAVRRLHGIDKAPPRTLVDEASIKAWARNQRKVAKREASKLRKQYIGARKRLDMIERRATAPQEHETLTGRTETTYPGGTVRDAPKGWKVVGTGKDARWVNMANPRQRRIPDSTKRINKQLKEQRTKVEKLERQYLEKQRYLTEARAPQLPPMYHGTTPEAAKAIQGEGFKLGPSDAVWMGSESVAKRYGDEIIETHLQPGAKVYDATKARQDNIAAMPPWAPAEDLRAAGYDAVLATAPDGTATLKVLNPDMAKPGPAPVRPDMAEATNRAYLENLHREATPGELPATPVQGLTPNTRTARYIEREARKRGVDTSGVSYVHADPTEGVERAAFAPGQGQHAPKPFKETTYQTLATGRMDLRMSKVLPEQIARNIKGPVAREIIGEMIDKWTPASVTTRAGTPLHARGISWQERKTIMDKAPEVMDDYVWWNPGIAGDALKLLDDASSPETLGEDFLGKWEKDWSASLDRTGEHGHDGPWYLLDKTRAQQMEDSIKFNSGLAQRLSRKVLKGLPSKLVLMASPSWAMLQVLNNVELAGLGGMVNPFQYRNAVKVMREMKREFPDEYERLTGASSQGVIQHEFERTHLGAPGDKLARDHPLVGRPLAYFKDTWAKWNDAIERAPAPLRNAAYVGKEIASFRFLFHGDAANNAFFRKTFLLDEANRIKFKGLENAMAQEAGAIGRIMRGFQGNHVTAKDMADLVNDPEALEHMARSTSELFGNYTDFTPAERKYLENNLMFYGFMRFSLRFMLYTMPVQHPLVTATLLKLSSLKNDEVRRLLGTGPNDPIPFGAIGALYKIDGNKITGRLPTNRINPFLNPITSAVGSDAPPSQVLGAFSPMLTEFAQQTLGTSFFTGKNWYLKGPHESQRLTGPADPRMPGYGPSDWETRARIALSHLMQLATPGRIAAQESAGGRPVAETSLPWDPQPIRFKDEETLKNIGKRAKQEGKIGKGERYLRGLTDPVYSAVTGDWAPSYDKEVAKYLLEQEKRYVRPGKKKKRGPRGGSLGSGTGGGSLGSGM